MAWRGTGRLVSSKVVVCLSGGMDSCVTLAMAAQAHAVYALHFTYGQRTAKRERQSFEALCDHYAVAARLVAPQPALGAMGGSALTDTSIAVPTEDSGSSVPVTYVPFRNGQILALACAWAEVVGAEAVYLGAVEEDSSGYPDCRESFFDAFTVALNEGTRPETSIEIRTPLLHLSKSQIVGRGIDQGAPLGLTWSCYSREDVACGECESCRLRLAGFAAAGVNDPIPYASQPR